MFFKANHIVKLVDIYYIYLSDLYNIIKRSIHPTLLNDLELTINDHS